MFYNIQNIYDKKTEMFKRSYRDGTLIHEMLDNLASTVSVFNMTFINYQSGFLFNARTDTLLTTFLQYAKYITFLVVQVRSL